MPITYRQHQDTRDGKIYNCVLMPDGRWWSAENLAYAGGDRLPPNGNPANVSSFGYLYSAISSAEIIPGTHIPTQFETFAMLNALGLGSVSWGATIPTDISNGLRDAEFSAGLNTFGFSALAAGYCHGGSYYQFGSFASFHTSNSLYSWYLSSAGGAATSAGTYKSVRFIVDAFNEPHPLKLFGVKFDGFERGMTVTIRRPIQVKDSIGGSVKLIPYGSAIHDEWQVETELWVNAERAAELEAAVPPYSVPSTTDMMLPPRGGSSSFPGLRPALAGANADKYIDAQVTRFEGQGRKGVVTDLHGYFLDFTLRAWGDGQATNQASAPTATAPAWLEKKFAARQLQDWSKQTPTVTTGGFQQTYLRAKHGRRYDINFNLDHLDTTQANDLVAYFRGVRHNVTTITCDNGPNGQQSIAVYLVGLTLHRTGLHWDGTLETILA